MLVLLKHTKKTNGGGDNMPNMELLEKAIQESGLKKSHIAEALGMSRPTFNSYMEDGQKFRVSHMDTLCELLQIDPAQRESIFFGQSGAFKATE